MVGAKAGEGFLKRPRLWSLELVRPHDARTCARSVRGSGIAAARRGPQAPRAPPAGYLCQGPRWVVTSISSLRWRHTPLEISLNLHLRGEKTEILTFLAELMS